MTTRASSPLRLGLLAAVAGLLIGREWEARRGGEVTVLAAVDPTPSLHQGIPGERWAHARHPAEPRSVLEDREHLAQIGYATGKLPPRDRGGVVCHLPRRAHPGLNLAVYGHAEGAWLFDMDGRTRHTWRLDLARHVPADRAPTLRYWRRVHAYPDGSLLAIYEGLNLVKVDRDSKLLWVAAEGAHHDLEVLPDGRILVLTRAARVIPEVHPTRPTLEDFVTVLDADGRELERVSILAALGRSPWAPLADRLPDWGDVTHANTLEVLDGGWAGRAPAFAAGHVLLSLREIDTIAVLDLSSRTIPWALSGHWRAQHQPTVVGDGRLLLFDNKGRAGRSRVLEFDPLSQEIAWEYPTDPDSDFFSAECGSAQRLSNGNTLITETDAGRALEVDRDGRVVWEYSSPFRAGPDDRFVATLFEVLRLPADYGAAWLSDEAH